VAAFGKAVNGIGAVVFVVTGIWGLVLSLDIITDVIGFWGMIAAIILAPVTFFAVPVYAGLALGTWFPALLNYGGCLLAILLMAVGTRLDRDAGGIARSDGSNRAPSGQ